MFTALLSIGLGIVSFCLLGYTLAYKMPVMKTIGNTQQKKQSSNESYTNSGDASSNDANAEFVMMGENFKRNNPDGSIYFVKGVRGRQLRVFEDKCIIKTTVTIGSLMTRNATDGEKTIYYSDVIGIQFKESRFTIGYLQLETASSSGNNRGSNYFSENSFTFDPSTVSNECMREVEQYIRARVEEHKRTMREGMAPRQFSSSSAADELKKYKELLDMGVITQTEFEEKKKHLLNL